MTNPGGGDSQDAQTPRTDGRTTPRGPTQGQFSANEWKPRPLAAQAVALALRGGPIVVSILAGLITARLLPRVSGWLWIGWVVAVVGASQAALVIGEKAARRLLPLSTMLRFSLAFPDQAPSRMGAALRSGNTERTRRDVLNATKNGLPADRQQALETALAMVAELNRHDRGTRGHSEKVRAISEMLAEELGMSREDRGKLRWGALLHDMGKLTVPHEILNKGGRPSQEEWQVLQRHPAEGERILAPLAEWLGDAVHAAGQHHERWDGKGYPSGLQGTEISLSARIVAVADAFAVMTSARAYKKPLPLALARQELTKNAGTQFDPTVVRAMLSVSVGRMSRTSGFLAPLANLPFLGPLIGASTSVPTVVGSGVTALLMTASLSVPSSPLEWANPFPLPADSPPGMLALTDSETTPPGSPGSDNVVTPTTAPPSTPNPSQRQAGGPNVSNESDGSNLSDELQFETGSSFAQPASALSSDDVAGSSGSGPGTGPDGTGGPIEPGSAVGSDGGDGNGGGPGTIVMGGSGANGGGSTGATTATSSATTSPAGTSTSKVPRSSTTTSAPSTTTPPETKPPSETKPPRSITTFPVSTTSTTSTTSSTTIVQEPTTTNPPETRPPRQPPFATTTIAPSISLPTSPPTSTTEVPEKTTTTAGTTPPIIATTVVTTPPIISPPETSTIPEKKG